MNRLVMRLVINAAALWAAVRLVEGIRADTQVETLVVVALIFGIVNSVIRPIVIVLSCPLQILTLGLFTLVINALMLLLTSAFANSLGVEFRVDGFGAAFIGSLIISLVSVLLSVFLHDED